MLYYFIKFKKDLGPERFKFKNLHAMFYDLEVLIIERGMIEWMIEDS